MGNGSRAPNGLGASLMETLTKAGLRPELAARLHSVPHRTIQVEPRRPFREPGAVRDEMIFVRSGILSKFKTDGSGRRQIIALRFAGDGILPTTHPADFGIQAITRSEVIVGRGSDFEPIIDEHPEIARFFWRLSQRHASISYEWLVNCGRRDSTARVAHLLCETAERTGLGEQADSMQNPFTQQQIADITGQTSVNVNRVLADLERQGLIARKGREIMFNDWPEMRRLASFQPEYLRY